MFFTKMPTRQTAFGRFAKQLKIVSVIACLGAVYPACAIFPQTDLRDYYMEYGYAVFPTGVTSTRPPLELLPLVRVVGGGFEPPPLVGQGYSLYSLLSLGKDTTNTQLIFFGYGEYVCGGNLRIPTSPTVESNLTISNNVWYSGGGRSNSCDTIGPLTSPKRFTTDKLTFGAPVRRTAINGGQYDASPMKLTRNGLPWYTYFFGYHLGLVANESNWDNANANKAGDLNGFFQFPSPLNNFELTALPPPWVEDDVVEYVNKQDFPKQPGGQFFYAVLASDKAALDAVPAWQRTGKSFKSGGYVSVCRFYGGKNGGPNTHFYSADDKECAALKSVPVLSYEGQTFAVNMPLPGANADGTKPCPIDSKPLYRLYNNASAPGKDYVSNHRYVNERTDVNAAVAQGWVDEGQVMCVPL